MQTILKAILGFLFFLCLFILDTITREYLFKLTMMAIKGSEETATPVRIKLMRIVSDYGVNVPSAILFIPTLVTLSRLKCLLILSSGVFLTYLGGILKSFYQDPRPFWTDPSITTYDFSISFGNPSGHSLLITFASLNIILVMIVPNSDMEEGKKEERRMEYRGYMEYKGYKENKEYIWGIKAILCGILLGLIPLVMYSRVYVAAHSIDQVFYGCSLSLLTIFILLYLLRTPIINHFKILLLITPNSETTISTKTYTTEMAKGILFFLFLGIIGVLEYYMRDISYALPEKYLVVLRTYQPVTDLQAPLESNASKYAITGFGIGIYIGLYISTHILHVDLRRWALKTSFLNYVLRFLVIILTFIPALILILILPGHTYLLKFLVRYAISFLLLAISLFGFSDYLCIQFNILPQIPIQHISPSSFLRYTPI